MTLEFSKLDLPPDLRKKLANITDGWSARPALQRWAQTCRDLHDLNVDPDVYRIVWEACFQDWDPTVKGPVPMWSRWHTRKCNNSNMADWMTGLKDSCPHLVDFNEQNEITSWWMKDRPGFWQRAVKRLGIKFATTATRTLDDARGPAHAIWFPGARMNIVESCFQSGPDQTAIVAQASGGEIRETTFGQLRSLTNRVSNSVVAAGYQPGDALAVVMPMTELSVAVYLGVVQAGCVIVSIADSFASPEIATRLKIADAKAVLTYDFQLRCGRKLDLFTRVAAASDIPAIVISAGETSQIALRKNDLTWDDFLVSGDTFEPVICDASDPINVLFSSGTTGEPKAIPWSHLTPVKCAIDGHCHQDIRPEQVCVWPTNLGWMMGPWLIFASLINRAKIGLYEDAPVGKGFGRFVQDARVNMLGVVPTLVRTWRASRSMEEFDWSAIEVFSSTGESSQRDDMFYLSALAHIRPVIEYCGGTEIGGGYITSSVQFPNVPAAFNTPAVGLDFLLLDDAGNCADEGEVFLIGPSVGLSTELLNRDHFKTYHEGAPEVAGYEGLRRHGDHFQRLKTDDPNVSYYVAGGRVDDTMNLGGIKISSAEIERVLNLLDGVRETAACAVIVDGGPSQLVVFAVVDGDRGSDDWRADMTNQIRQQLNPLFKISDLRIVESLPRTASGKVMRRELRKEIGGS